MKFKLIIGLMFCLFLIGLTTAQSFPKPIMVNGTTYNLIGFGEDSPLGEVCVILKEYSAQPCINRSNVDKNTGTFNSNALIELGVRIDGIKSAICEESGECSKTNQINPIIIDANIVIAEEFFTKSKVPDPLGKYFNLFNNSLFNKLTHFAYNPMRNALDAEVRWVGAEGYIACDRKCTIESKKWEEYQICKINC